MTDPPIVEAPGYRGPDRRRQRGPNHWARVAGAACILALFAAIGGLFHELDQERDARSKADAASIEERRTVACVVRGVLELSRSRAKARGTFTEEDEALFASALAPLRTDCDPLIVPPEGGPNPTPPPPDRFPRDPDRR